MRTVLVIGFSIESVFWDGQIGDGQICDIAHEDGSNCKWREIICSVGKLLRKVE